MKRLAYYQGTADPNEKRSPDKMPTPRIDMDTRHPHIYTWYHNADYTSDLDPGETGIGGGLYHGPMDRFKNVKQYLEYRRKKLKERRDKISQRMDSLVKFANLIGVK